jgi:hypothetical protein
VRGSHPLCLRVEPSTNKANDVNTCNNMAQHNFFNVDTAPGQWGVGLMVIANPFEDREAVMELQADSTLPEKWQVLFNGEPLLKSIGLRPGELRGVKVSVEVPDQPLIEWPIGGTVVGKVDGTLAGQIEARLDEVARISDDEFEGRLRGRFDGGFVARFEAHIAGVILDRQTGELRGKLRGMAYEAASGKPLAMEGEVYGWLTPERRVSVGGRIAGKEAGGVDFNLVLKR